MATKLKKLAPIQPGQVLRAVLEDAGVTANALALALALRIPANRLTGIINGPRSISADPALRLARYFGTSAQMWMNLQAKYDLATAEDALAGRIEAEVQPMRRASWHAPEHQVPGLRFLFPDQMRVGFFVLVADKFD